MLLACEPLRPVVDGTESASQTGRSYPPGLPSARRLYRDGAAFPKVAAHLRQSILSADSIQQAEPAQLLLIRVYLEWYQRIRIADQALPKVKGSSGLYGSLMTQLQFLPGEGGPSQAGQSAATINSVDKLRLNRVKKNRRGGVYEVIDEMRISGDSTPVTAAEVREELFTTIGTLDKAKGARSRMFAKSARQFLTLESKWSYRSTSGDKAAAVRSLTRQWIAFSDQHKSSGLADNAWLAVAVRSVESLRHPRVPHRSALQTIAELVQHTGKSEGLSDQSLFRQLGRGKGSTMVEVGVRSWAAVRTRVDSVLKQRVRTFAKSDAAFFWSALASEWQWNEQPDPESLRALYEFSQTNRRASVRSWLQGLRARTTIDYALLDHLEAVLPGRLNRHEKAGLTVAANALWVMAVAVMEVAIDVQLGDTSTARRSRLAPGKVFEERSLMLPNGGRVLAYPKRVRRCIMHKRRTSKGCLRRLLRKNVRQAKQSVEPRNHAHERLRMRHRHPAPAAAPR